jgi:BlaI family penicillinase repressor
VSLLKKGEGYMKQLKRLSAAEMEVMKVVWELNEPVTVAQVLSIFEETKGWKTSTLATLLLRLMKKGFLTKEIRNKTNNYVATLTLEEYKKYEAKSLLSNLYGGNVKNFVAALVDDSGNSREELDELEKWFAQKASDLA